MGLSVTMVLKEKVILCVLTKTAILVVQKNYLTTLNFLKIGTALSVIVALKEKVILCV